MEVEVIRCLPHQGDLRVARLRPFATEPAIDLVHGVASTRAPWNFLTAMVRTLKNAIVVVIIITIIITIITSVAIFASVIS